MNVFFCTRKDKLSIQQFEDTVSSYRKFQSFFWHDKRLFYSRNLSLENALTYKTIILGEREREREKERERERGDRDRET